MSISNEEIDRARAFARESGLADGTPAPEAIAVADYRLLKRIEAIERVLGITFTEDTLSAAPVKP